MKDSPPPRNQPEKAGDSPTRTSGKSPGELAAEAKQLPMDIKERLIPPMGHIIYTIMQSVDGRWRRLAFRVSHRNVGKARATIELLGWANEPHPTKAQVYPADTKPGTVTLDVHDGVIGGGSKFT